MADLLILHDTESSNFVRQVADFRANMGKAPHELFDPITSAAETFYGWGSPSKSLKNKPGGVETNNRPGGVIQLEVLGFKANLDTYSDQWYQTLAAEILRICRITGVPPVFPVMSDRRLSMAEWSNPNLRGVVGHVNVPENDHVDGWMPRVIPYVTGGITVSTDAPSQPDPDVAAIQAAMNQAGAQPPLLVDGWFGPKTRDAVLGVVNYQGWRMGTMSGALQGIVDAAQKALNPT